ncbi:Polymerase/histidinol phosphatase-like protein [Cladochytrium replicatum]|nr:Polymerase/histidinol phosphatase-like protein [Cladochytrium replicatum]
MPVSFHSHSGSYCLHAAGTLDEVIARVRELKFVAFALSEHMPRNRPQDLYPEETHITPEITEKMFNDYLTHARQIQRDTKDVEIIVGAETDWIHPGTLSQISGFRSKVDYIVGSIHHVLGIPIDFDEETLEKARMACVEALDETGGSVSPTEALYRRYYDEQFEMLKSVKPEVIGHFDLVKLFNPNHSISDEVWSRIQRNVRFIVEYGGVVEINASAFRKGWSEPYPSRRIVKYMQSEGVKFVLSDDSHGPNAVAMNYYKLHEYLKEMEISKVFYWTRLRSSSGSENSRLELQSVENVLDHPFWDRILKDQI